MFNIESPSSKDALCKVGLKLVQWLTRFLNFAFSLVSLLGKGCDLLLEQTRIPINQGCFVSSLVDISQVVLEKFFFLILSFFFRYFVIISSWRKMWPFFWTNLNPYHLRMICLFEIGDVVLDDNDDDGQEKNIRAISSGELKSECFRYPELKVKAFPSFSPELLSQFQPNF